MTINDRYNQQKLDSASDSVILKIIGEFIKHCRLEQNKSQEQLAKDAGINRSTLIDLENGGNSSTLTLVQLLRTLNLLHVIKQFEINSEISPLELAKKELTKRKRATKARKEKRKKKPKSDW